MMPQAQFHLWESVNLRSWRMDRRNWWFSANSLFCCDGKEASLSRLACLQTTLNIKLSEDRTAQWCKGRQVCYTLERSLDKSVWCENRHSSNFSLMLFLVCTKQHRHFLCCLTTPCFQYAFKLRCVHCYTHFESHWDLNAARCQAFYVTSQVYSIDKVHRSFYLFSKANL